MKKIYFSILFIMACFFTTAVKAQSQFPIIPGSSMSDSDDNQVLRSWLQQVGPTPSGRLLYKRSRDGASAIAFHNKVDDQGPTLVLFRTSNGTVFGGFSEASWGGSIGYRSSNQAFLFNLKTNRKGQIRSPQQSIYNHPSYGPTFGAGHDIRMDGNMNSGSIRNYSYFAVDGSSYGSNAAIRALIGTSNVFGGGTYNFSHGFITEIEVFAIEFNSSAPTIEGNDITVALDETGSASITVADIDNGTNDPDGIASMSLDKTSFDCDNSVSSRVVAPTFVEQVIQPGTSVGAAYNPVTNEFWMPQWNGAVINRYDENQQFLGSFNSGVNQNIQVWMDIESATNNEYYTSNNANYYVTKRRGEQTLWSHPVGFYARGITTDQQYVYVSILGRNVIRVINKSTGDFVRNISLPGNLSSIGGLVYANGKLYLSGLAQNWSQLPNNYGAIHIFDLATETYESSFSTGLPQVRGLAFDGELLWAYSYNNAAFRGYRISDGNAYLNTQENTSTVVLTAIDGLGYSSSQTFQVTVEDPFGPSISLNGDATMNIIEGETFTDPGATATDNCGATVTVTGTVDTNVQGEYTLTYQATDDWGNQSEIVVRTVLVGPSDADPPTFDFTPIALTLDEAGTATLLLEDFSDVITDPSGVASIDFTSASFDCSHVGENTLTITATDNVGNSGSADLIVNVIDDEAPVVVVQDIAVSLDANGSATIAASKIDNGSADACGIASYVLDVSSFDCSNVGANTVTLTVTDNNGNPSSAEATVTVVDDEAPVVVVQDIAVSLDANGSATITASQIDNGSADACGIASYVLDVSSFDCSNVGANTVTLTVTDNNGNPSSAQATVTVVDDEAPVVVVQDIAVSLDANGSATTAASQIDNGSADACGIASYVLDVSSFDCSNVGANTVTLTVTDNNGNQSSAQATVTVVDDEAPVVVVQDIAVSLDANGSATITASQIDNGSADACGIASYVLDVSSFDCSNVGANTVTLTVTDNNGNPSSAQATVTVVDDEAPVVVVQDIAVSLDANGSATIAASQIDNGSADACGIASYVLDVSSFDCSNVGANTVTLTVTDNNGNPSSAQATVTVVDDVAPVVVVQDIAVSLDANGSATITASQIDNGSADACGIASYVLDVSSFDCSNVGANTVTLTVTDNNGNPSSAQATVTVVDDEAPVVVVQDIAVSLDANGSATIAASQIDNGSADACGIASYVLDVSSFDCSNVGANTVTLTVTDNNGNPSSAEATVTVVDDVAPVVVVQDIAVSLDANGSATVAASQIDNGSADACGIASYVLDVSSFDCSNVGANTVTLTVTDNNGNPSSAQATVTVVDDVAPVVVVQDIAVSLDANGSATITASQIDDGSVDACGIASFVLDVSSFDCSNVGANTVTLTVTDNNGNPSSAQATVTVVDDEAPIVVVQDIAVSLDANGSATIAASQIDNGSADACGIASYVLDVTSFDCSNVGANTVTLTVTDNNGNPSSAQATVTVADDVAPVIEAPVAIVEGNDPNLCGAVINLEAPVASDNCAVVSLTNNAPSVFPVGETTVTWEALDASGNATTAVQYVTVTNDAPVIGVVNVAAAPVLVGDYFESTAVYTDNNLANAEWYWGDGSMASGTIDGNTVYGEHSYAAPGLYQVTLVLTDRCNETVTYVHESHVVAYDPDAGFVTGGGWINSPAGAITDDPEFSGKGNFGFVARYMKNKATPKGSLNFKVGSINLKSKSMDYLVLRNHMAIFKGSGNLQGVGDVSFIASIVDGDIYGFQSDNLRMKIWDEASGKVYYDNEGGQAINLESSFAISQGSIVIHLDKSYDNTSSLYQAFPNPFTDAVQLNVNVPSAQTLEVMAFDNSGNVIFTQNRDLLSGENGLRFDLIYYNLSKDEVIIMRCVSPSLGSFYVKLIKK